MTDTTRDSGSPIDTVGGLTDLEPWVREALRCPVTRTELREEIGPDGELRLVNSSPERPLAYPVRSGVPVLLPDEAITLG